MSGRTVASAIDDFVAECEAGREGGKVLKPSTIRSYRQKLGPLRDLFGTKLVTQFTVQDGKTYRDHLLHNLNIKRTQAKNNFVVATMVFQWLVGEKEEITSNPLKAVLFKVSVSEAITEVRQEDLWSDEEVWCLINAAQC